MVIHKDFQMIRDRFMSNFPTTGEFLFQKFIENKGLNVFAPLPNKAETKEFRCNVVGVEIKEDEQCFHVEGLIATSHIDNTDIEEGVGIPDRIPKETLESFADQINSNKSARIMGAHHSEGTNRNPVYLNWVESIGAENLVDNATGKEFFGEADVSVTPAKVVTLVDGEHGLFVDTKLFKNDPMTPKIIDGFNNGHFNSFSITYETDGFQTTDFEKNGEGLVRVLLPTTRLAGYTASSHPKNLNTIATGYGFKEFKELINLNNNNLPSKSEGLNLHGENRVQKEVEKMSKENLEKKEDPAQDPKDDPKADPKVDADPKAPEQPSQEKVEQPSNGNEDPEQKEFLKFKADKKVREQKEIIDNTVSKIAEGVLAKVEIKEKVIQNKDNPVVSKEVSLELKEFKEVINNPGIELKEQFRRAAAACDFKELNWQESFTPAVESREYKNFGVNGRKLEFKGLGITTNQNTDTDYLQSSAELQDIYDPVIYNALNQTTLLWNLLAKDDFSKKGNNQAQFTLKTAANTSAAFYLGNAVTTGNVTRLKYQTKFKKLQVGVSVDGDMIAAARGGPVSDVFAQEVMDSTLDMLAILNLALFAEVGLETVAAVIGLEYITDSAGNTSLYNLTRTAANRLGPDSAGDTYINGSATVISMANIRSAIRQAILESANKSNLVWVTAPLQGDMLRNSMDDARRLLTSKATDFGFSTDLFVDGIPVFEDKDCNTDDWFLIDLETHRVAMWIPPTIERLGKSADSEDAFVKMYFATYNRAPRRMVQIYNNATS